MRTHIRGRYHKEVTSEELKTDGCTGEVSRICHFIVQSKVCLGTKLLDKRSESFTVAMATANIALQVGKITTNHEKPYKMPTAVLFRHFVPNKIVTSQAPPNLGVLC